MIRHFEPLRPHRSNGVTERYEFTHGERSVCVYDMKTLDFVSEILVGENPDCHATSSDNRFLYMACHDGLWCISQETLEVVKLLEIPYLYAVNALPDGETLLAHDQCGGIIIIKEAIDMDKIHVYKRVQVIPNGKYRCEIGGKGNFTADGRYYLCAGWLDSVIYLFDTENEFNFEIFIGVDKRLYASDDLVLNADKTKAYTACHTNDRPSHVTVVDVMNRKIIKTIETGMGSCGLAMTGDERYVIVSNDGEDSISVIDTNTDELVNTISAKEGFEKLGMKGYIQGISCGTDDSVYVYGCSGNGAIVKFHHPITSKNYTISHSGGKQVF